jgi:hypothetical protein
VLQGESQQNSNWNQQLLFPLRNSLQAKDLHGQSIHSLNENHLAMLSLSDFFDHSILLVLLPHNQLAVYLPACSPHMHAPRAGGAGVAVVAETWKA